MNKYHIPCVVSIAGTDPSGGAGIQADIKVISATGSYAASVITALVAQNTQGVQAIQEVSAEFVRLQLRSVFSDLNIQAIKIGMLHDARIIDVVASELLRLKPKYVVFDPVMVAKDGSILLDLSTIERIKDKLFTPVSLITPNLFEAEHLIGADINTLPDMESSAIYLGRKFNLNVLVKGGHLNDKQSSDVLYSHEDNQCYWFHAERVTTTNTHGTGCSLSSAIASYLAQGLLLVDAIKKAKHYLTDAIRAGVNLDVGFGNGPVDHFYFLANRKN
ncbi:MAG: bifunctional hydroxymethylpyrimidine kinase/phosphomethylpyrimidine kinase [Legionellaceae bacterium]|nr:bifunctional hydroxymethylpyrimidine kinase/phosphomethylpyrimidine kinase [Legionellaceae bacterium]